MAIHVFVVDDHAVVREGLRMLLELQPDMRVIGDAPNGREAVRLAQRQCPDVIVMDVMMPDLNGIEATRQLRTVCPTARVVILSMYEGVEYVARALGAGAVGYVLKEASSAELMNAVRSAHAGLRYISQKISYTGRDVDQQLAASPLLMLSDREREIFQLIVEGKTSAQIGSMLQLSPKTVETYRSRLMRKLGLHDLPSLVKFAIRHGVIALN